MVTKRLLRHNTRLLHRGSDRGLVVVRRRVSAGDAGVPIVSGRCLVRRSRRAERFGPSAVPNLEGGVVVVLRAGGGMFVVGGIGRVGRSRVGRRREMGRGVGRMGIVAVVVVGRMGVVEGMAAVVRMGIVVVVVGRMGIAGHRIPRRIEGEGV